MKNYFVQGAIQPQLVAEIIAKQQSNTSIGGNAIFLGQVRADETEEKTTQKIIYSAYNEMANTGFHLIETQMLEKYDDLQEIIIKHSIGDVHAGEISMLVYITAGHRLQAFEAIKETVNLIKANVPIWKKEVLDDNSHLWTENH